MESLTVAFIDTYIDIIANHMLSTGFTDSVPMYIFQWRIVKLLTEPS